MCPVYLGIFWTKRKIELHKYGFWTSSMCLKKSSLAPGPTLPPGLVLHSMSSSSYSSSCCLLPQTLCPSLHYTGRGPDELGLMPLALRVQQFSLVAGYIRAFLHAHCEWFLISFQYSHLKVVGKGFILSFSSMCVLQMLIESGFLPDLCCFAVKLWHMLFYVTMCILSRLAKVASSVTVNIVISWEASLEAEINLLRSRIGFWIGSLGNIIFDILEPPAV